MPTPYQSPTTPVEKQGKQRGRVAWGKGLVMGLGSWVGLAVVCLLLLDLGPSLLSRILLFSITPVKAIWGSLGIHAPPGLFVLSLLSGVLLHATFWTVVFTVWRRRAE